MMLNSLVIKNFRMLEDFTVEKLGRVNLIVGKNNSGKSTVLEALRIYSKNVSCNSNECSNSYNGNFDVKNKVIYLGENENNLVDATKIPLLNKCNCSFIPTQFILLKELQKEWKSIELSDDEEIVTRALQIIVPNYQRLAFDSVISSDSKILDYRIKIKLSHLSKAIPITSLGDGMLRILQIAIKLVSAQGGFLLIDEFENGLHYSVQENVWRLLFEMAEKLDIQVFATTHSWDCIESFTKVALENDKTEGILFRMGKSALAKNKGQVIATVYDKEDLYELTEINMEIR